MGASLFYKKKKVKSVNLSPETGALGDRSYRVFCQYCKILSKFNVFYQIWIRVGGIMGKNSKVIRGY